MNIIISRHQCCSKQLSICIDTQYLNNGTCKPQYFRTINTNFIFFNRNQSTHEMFGKCVVRNGWTDDNIWFLSFMNIINSINAVKCGCKICFSCLECLNYFCTGNSSFTFIFAFPFLRSSSRYHGRIFILLTRLLFIKTFEIYHVFCAFI